MAILVSVWLISFRDGYSFFGGCADGAFGFGLGVAVLVRCLLCGRFFAQAAGLGKP